MPPSISSLLTRLHLHSSDLSQELVRPVLSVVEESQKQAEDKADLPSIQQCAIHFEMLEAFYALRKRVTASRKLAKALIRIHIKKSHGKAHKDRELSDTWYRFLSIAVVRFQKWIRATDHHLRAKQPEMNDPIVLPPLDILMVWHAFLLNPHDFSGYCISNHLNHIRDLSFPWTAVHQALSQENWNYTLPDRTATWLFDELNIAPDLIMALQRNEAMTAKDIATTVSAENTPLIDNILRQGIFIDKMHNLLWICSPALQGTLARALARYEHFVTLFRLHPDKILVPTLDVDLVWHTHLCSAELYEKSMLERTGRYINHDDKLGEEVLTGAFETTGELFEAATGEIYGVCFCWDCEAMRSAGEMVGGEVGADARKKVEEEVDSYWRAEMARQK